MTSPAAPAAIDIAASEHAAHRWHTIASADANDPAARARIDTAAQLADAALAAAARGGWARPDTAGPDVFDACQAWSRIALLWHQVLTDTNTFTAARTNSHASCRADVDTIRRWLAAADGQATVAATLGLDEYFDLYGFDKFDRLTRLVAAAQEAAVFGVDGHRVEIIHEAGDRGYVDAHRVTLSTPQHGTLCSGRIDSLAIFTDHLCGPDAAVHALTVIAEHTDELLTQRALLADTTWPTPTRATSRGQAQPPTAPATPADVARPTAHQAPAAEPAPTAASLAAPAGRAFRPLAVRPQAAAPASAPAPDAAARHGRRR